MNHKALAAEFIGTFTLLFVGVGSIAAGAGNLGIALAHGLAIAAMIWAVGAVSGAHFNPAVSWAMFAAKRIEVSTMISYWIAQIVGGIAGVFALKQCIAGEVLSQVGMGAPSVGDGVTMGGAIVMEAVLTFFLVVVIFGAAIDRRANTACAGLYIGLTVTMAALAAGGVTGAGLNPARFLGSAVFHQDAMSDLTVYLVGPFLGATLGALFYAHLLEDRSVPGRENEGKGPA